MCGQEWGGACPHSPSRGVCWNKCFPGQGYLMSASFLPLLWFVAGLLLNRKPAVLLAVERKVPSHSPQGNFFSLKKRPTGEGTRQTNMKVDGQRGGGGSAGVWRGVNMAKYIV